MSKANEPAFPGEPVQFAQPGAPVADVELRFMGLTKREYFASKAMQGFVGTIAEKPIVFETLVKKFDAPCEVVVARLSISYADALLAELERVK
jgi:hypothetical protein